ADEIAVPPQQPVLEGFGVGTGSAGWRHRGIDAALPAGGSRGGWLVVMVTSGTRYLSVTVDADYAPAGQPHGSRSASVLIGLPGPGPVDGEEQNVFLALDVVGYSNLDVANQDTVQARLERLIRRVLQGVDTDFDRCESQKGGDGATVMLPRRVRPKHALPLLL